MMQGELNRAGQQVALRMPAAGAASLAVSGAGTALIGDSPAMQAVIQQVRRVAPTTSSVLLIGEHGTGKELIARHLHDVSPRGNEPFVVVDCAAVATERMDAELFGVAPGTNGNGSASYQPHPGQIALAGAGTLLLKEVTKLPLDAQVRLLEALESGHFAPAGVTAGQPDTDKQVRCRVLSTTTVDAQQAVEQGQLRADLLYRLAVFPILVPPLRQRDGDIELLATEYLRGLNAVEGTSKQLSAESLASLKRYTWPGNVWELRNAVHRAYVLADEELDLRAVAGKPLLPSSNGDAQALRIPVGTNLAEAERWMIIATLKKCGGNKTRAAALLGVSLKTLYNRLNTYRAQGQDLSEIDGELTEVAV